MRVTDWHSRLVAMLASYARAPFRWGHHDCLTLACDVRLALTGQDILAPWRGGYEDMASGLRLAARHGFADHVAFAVQGLPEIAPAFAQVGDLATVPDEGGAPVLGLVGGDAIHVLRPRGLGRVPLLSAKRAWRI